MVDSVHPGLMEISRKDAVACVRASRASKPEWSERIGTSGYNTS